MRYTAWACIPREPGEGWGKSVVMRVGLRHICEHRARIVHTRIHTQYVIQEALMLGFSHLARTVAVAAALAFSGAAMAKAGSSSEKLQPTNGNTVALPDGAIPQALSIFNVAGINSFAAIGSPANTVVLLNVGANAQITGVGWNVIISAFTPSWLSEMVVSFENSAQTDGVFLTVASGDGFAGLNAPYSSGGVLALGALTFNVGADGLLRIEFFEDFDDDAVNPDGRWVSGNLTFETAGVIPEPSTYGLMALGLLGVAGAVRRRRTA